MIFDIKQKNKVPEVTMLGLFIAATVAFVFSQIKLIPGRGILQLVAMGFFCVLVFIAVRYKFTYFRYSVRKAASPRKSLHREDEDDDDSSETVHEGVGADVPITALSPALLELCADRRQGNGKWSTECVLRLTDIISCVELPYEKDKYEQLLQENRKVPRYKYFRNLAVPEQTVILANPPSGKVIVYLETEKKLTEYLRAIANYNNEN